MQLFNERSLVDKRYALEYSKETKSARFKQKFVTPEQFVESTKAIYTT